MLCLAKSLICWCQAGVIANDSCKLMRILVLYLILTLCSCNSNKVDNYFELIEQNDQKLTKPEYGDWLFTHKEKGQNLEEFINSKPIKPSDKANIIYLRPIGTFH